MAGRHGLPVRHCRVDALGGGDTGATFQVDLNGRPAFLKWLPDGDALDAEADGLAALAKAIRVPEVLDHDDLAGGRALLLEWLPLAAPGEPFWPALGRALAALHGVEGERFGHHRDNWIGANPQYNRPDTDWPRFFVEQRLLPQLRGAPLVTVSAKTGRGLDRLHQAVMRAHEVWNTRVTTAQLNRWLAGMVEAHPPPAPGGRRIKLRYMTQTKTRPPGFVVMCSYPDKIAESYSRYLVNGLREDFDMPGTPIRLWMRGQGDQNPYKNKKKSTPSRLRKHLDKKPYK